ncbi:50S ribosomal protein L4 [Nocardioides sp. Iso805N]|uniref:50S ribosomal protein L4 n=1 Tax=Nocardioides sp. Iso805N TaxID=1283287 RepID=UPI000370B5FD|nr:50S ribosomal protein L4 [Nocardioides sp. Iso805N]
MALNTVKVDLPAEIFDVAVNVPLIHQVVVAQQAAARQGTHKTKNRGEVSGSGVKPFKQKGTGRSRQGSVRAPEHRGGGVVHGPQPRDYSQRTPKKMKAAALRGALSDRAQSGRVHVVDFALDKPSTKAAAAGLAGLTERTKFLVVLDRVESAAWLSLRNLPEVHIVAADQLNTYDVLAADDVVFSTAAYSAFTGAEVTVAPAKKTAAKKTAAKKAPAKAAAADETSAEEA